MAPRAHRGPHMDESVVILQSLKSLMATEQMLITTPWQYEDSRAGRPTCDSWQRRAVGVLEIAPKGIRNNDISRFDRRRHGAGRSRGGAGAGCRAVLR